MVVIEFADNEIRRRCCDLDRMRRAYGVTTARKISQRLQQLEAMQSIADLSVLPFDSTQTDGLIHVVVDDSLTMLLTAAHNPPEVDGMTKIVIQELRAAPASRPA